MSPFKSGLSALALLAGLSLVTYAPLAIAKTHCKTKVVMVKKVVCDCGPSHHAATPAHHAHHAVATTTYREPAYSRPSNVTYVDEVDSAPVTTYGQSVYLGESSYSSQTYSSQTYSSQSYSSGSQSSYPDNGCQTVCTYAPPVATYSNSCGDSCAYPQDSNVDYDDTFQGDDVAYDDSSYQDDGLYPNDGPYPYQDTSTYTGGVGYTDTGYAGGGGYYSDGYVAPAYGYGGTVVYLNGNGGYHGGGRGHDNHNGQGTWHQGGGQGHGDGGLHHGGGNGHGDGGMHHGGGSGQGGGGMHHGGGHMGGGTHTGGHYGGHH